MTPARPPAADDDEAYISVDHRVDEESIVTYVSDRLAADDALTTRFADDSLFVTFRGREHRLPLTISRHDRYVVISSLAELLKGDYRFFVVESRLDDDTHSLLVVPTSKAQAWDPLPGHLLPLRLGFDYFGKIKVPYLNREDSAPNFAAESEVARLSGEAVARLFTAFLTGKPDPETAAAFAKAAMKDPTLREYVDWPEHASEAEIVVLVEKAIDEALQDAAVKESRSEFDDAMQGLWKLTGGPPKKPL